ncbi:MAG: site-2 protease family protein [Candidatus Pacebacteria bacterium]|nr:site-2 protease family protein [Candidatus Paceibacterota bacterium]
MFIQLLWQRPDFYVVWVTVVVFSICVHEYMHAWVAYRMGDDTAVRQGYLTLNPLLTMGPQSLIFLALFGIAWGAVPVSPGRMRKQHGPGLTALAGPGTNFILAVLFALVARVATGVAADPVLLMCRIGTQANIFLLLFNLLPVPMLDGWEVYGLLFPKLRRVSPEKSRQAGFILLLIILLSGLIRYVWMAAAAIADMMI